MYNWNIDITELKKDPEKYAIWKLEQMINYGLCGEKLDANLLKKYWNSLNIDPQKRKTLLFLLWNKQS